MTWKRDKGEIENMKLMNVNELEKPKNIFLTAIRIKLMTSKASMERELEQKGKPAEKILLEILRETCSKIEGKHQRAVDYDTGLFFLFTYHKDSAHHQQGNYFLHQLLIRADEILPKLEWERRGFDYLDPKQWRVNMWMKSLKEKEHKKQKELERRERKLEKRQQL